MAEITIKTEKELYEDWKPLIEAEQDAMVEVDERLELEKLWVEQSNYGPGVSAGGPKTGQFPLVKRVDRPYAEIDETEIVDHDNDF